MRARLALHPALVVAAAALAAAAVARAQPPEGAGPPRPARVQVAEAFPHEKHAGLFPLCTGCHAGVLTGAPGELFPAPPLCARCHDGVQAERVVWEGRRFRPDNVAFDHAEHDASLEHAGDPLLDCAGCHAVAEERMSVAGRPDPQERCLGCHAHAAREHQVDGDCAACHVPLAASRFPEERIAALPEPRDHGREGFLAEEHGRAAVEASARCATCHVRQQCTSCHVDETSATLQAVPAAPTGMRAPSFEPRYPLPVEHAAPEWPLAHGGSASLAGCGTCHTRADCTVCHQRALPPAASALPEREPGRAPGARIRLRPPASHEARSFRVDHGGAAATQGTACATCHGGGFCADCHARGERSGADLATAVPPRLVDLLEPDRPGLVSPPAAPVHAGRAPARPGASPRPGFHPTNFALRHATAGWGQTLECANCHSVEAFCRACHVEAGLAPGGRPGAGFHDAGAAWLLGHGQAARQGLESCASCHRQSDCVRCHSPVGSFRVNPHGPSFDAARGWARAPETCLACHLGKPL